MKTAKEYRALAWKALKSQFKESFFIICGVMVAACGAVGLMYAAFFLLPDTMVGATGKAAAALAVLCTVGLFQYFVPVWFLKLSRKESALNEGTNISYGKALVVAFVMMLPSIVESGMDVASKRLETIENPWVMLPAALGLMVLMVGVVAGMIWWQYAINGILPFLVHDNPNESVAAMVKRSVKETNGYKWQLFMVDLMIYIWPMVVLVVGMIAMIITLVVMMIVAGTTDVTDLLGVSLWFLVTLGVFYGGFILFFAFIIQPMQNFAHAIFYEDLQAELHPIPVMEVEEVETVEEVEAEEIKA